MIGQGGGQLTLKTALKLINNKTTRSREAGEYLKGVKKIDLAICNYRRELYPDTLGYSDLSENKKLVPLHIRCSESVPWSIKLLFRKT